jgi:hypothetical protein
MKGSEMNRYRKTRRQKIVAALPWLILFPLILFIFYQLYDLNLRLKIESRPEELYPAQIKPKDPCMELRNQEDYLNRKIANLNQNMALFQADLALEIELSKTGQIPAYRVAEILKKHDVTHSKLYNKVYKNTDDLKKKVIK